MSYSVVEGDTLWGIYKRNKAKGNTSSWEDYKTANEEFANGKTMHEGDSVNIPEKTIPDEPAFEEPKVDEKPKEAEKELEVKEEPKSSEEKAQEAVDETKSEKVSNLDKSNCCCMVAPWTIQEEGRDYLLEVTKIVEEKFLNKPIEVSKKEHSNVKDYFQTLKGFLLESKDTGLNYNDILKYLSQTGYELQIIAPIENIKKIKINYNFLRKKCEQNMFLESIQGEKILKENSCLEVNKEGLLNGDFISSNNTHSFIDISDLDDWEIIIGALTSPKKIANKINLYPRIGNKRCTTQPKVNLFIFPSLKVDGTISLKYKPNFKTKKYKTNEFDATERDTHGKPKIKKGRYTEKTQELTVEGGIYGYYGDKTISYTSEKVFGGNEIERRKRKNNLTPRGFFNKIDKVFDVFIRANNAGGRFLNVEIGDIGFSLSIKDYKFIENPNEYNVDYEVNFVLVLMFFNNTKVKVDIVELILLYVARGSYVYKLLSDARIKAKEGKSLKVEVTIELGFFGGSIAFLKASKKIGEPLKLEKVKISPRVGLIAKAVVKAELQIHVVEVGGELGGVGASIDKATIPSQFIWNLGVSFDKDGSHFNSKTSFTGLAIYGMYKVYVKIKESEEGGFFSSVFGKTNTSKEGQVKPIVLAPKWGDAESIAVGIES